MLLIFLLLHFRIWLSEPIRQNTIPPKLIQINEFSLSKRFVNYSEICQLRHKLFTLGYGHYWSVQVFSFHPAQHHSVQQSLQYHQCNSILSSYLGSTYVSLFFVLLITITTPNTDCIIYFEWVPNVILI